MQGYGLGLQGLTSAANGQANAYNADQQRSSNDMAGLGQLAGIGLKAGLSYATGGSAAPLFMNNWGGT
jgi:hypothetical protein